MAVNASAYYGTAIYGESEYGVINAEFVVSGVSSSGAVTAPTSILGDANVTPTGAQSSATAGANLTITADAVSAVTTVVGTSAAGNVGTVGVAIVQTPSVSASNVAGSGLSFIGESSLLVSGVQATANVGQADGRPSTVIVGTDYTVPVLTGSAGSVAVTADASHAVSGISATASANADFTIEADSLHVSTSVFGTAATGGVGEVVAGAVIDSTPSVEATGGVTTAVIVATASFSFTGVQGTSSANADFTIEADSVHVSTSVQAVVASGGVGDVEASAITDTVTGVQASASTTTAAVLATATIATPSVSSTFSTGSLSITETQNVFQSTDRDETRAVYVVADESRVIYVDAA